MSKSYYVDDNLELLSWDTYQLAHREKASSTLEEAVERKRQELNVKLNELLKRKEYWYYVSGNLEIIRRDKNTSPGDLMNGLVADTPEEAIELRVNRVKNILTEQLINKRKENQL